MRDVVGGTKIAMPTGLGKHCPGRQDTWSVDHALFHQPRPVGIKPAGVPDSGETLLKGIFNDSPHREHIVDPGQITDPARRVDQAHVDMGVGKSWHQGQSRAVDHLVGRAAHPGADVTDDRARYGHIHARPGIVSGAVQEFGVADYETGHSSLPSW